MTHEPGGWSIPATIVIMLSTITIAVGAVHMDTGTICLGIAGLIIETTISISPTRKRNIMNTLRRLIRFCTLGLVGTSPKNRARIEQARLAKAERRSIDRRG